MSEQSEIEQAQLVCRTSGVAYLDGLKTNIHGLTQDVEGLTYLPWAVAMALAGRPKVKAVVFNEAAGYTVQHFFGGSVVAVENEGQRVYLPILNAKNQPVSREQLTSRDVNDARNRCRAKSIAITNGVGMCLYANFGTNNRGFLSEMGIRPDTDLSAIEPLTMKKNNRADYVDWGTALTAMRITDNQAKFRVLEFEVVNRDTGEIELLPFSADTEGTYEVAIEVTYKGESHVEWLPIMGVAEVKTKSGMKKMDHQPLRNPTVFNWNTSVMRCLAKAIAVATGYGLSVYAKESVTSLNVEVPQNTQQAPDNHDQAAQGSHDNSNTPSQSVHEPSYDTHPQDRTGQNQSAPPRATRSNPPARSPNAVNGRTGGRAF